MTWKKIPGLKGRVYVPDSPPGAPKKHTCVDCFSCQLCSDERCSVCRDCKAQSERPGGQGRIKVPRVPKVR